MTLKIVEKIKKPNTVNKTDNHRRDYGEEKGWVISRRIVPRKKSCQEK